MKITITPNQLQQNPLFWTQPDPVFVNASSNIFIGVGISTPTEISKNIPFDLMGFLLSAEFIKRHIPNSKVFILVADQHAWLANQFNKHQTKIISHNLQAVVERIIVRFELKNWHVHTASELFPDTPKQSYEELEKRDVTHFVEKHQVRIKVGWTFSPKDAQHHTDETHFDQHATNLQLTSIFTKPGITLDSKKPHESPYICTDPTSRITLSKSENINQKFTHSSDNLVNATKNHLAKICVLFESLVHQFPPKTPLESKLQQIQTEIFNPIR